MPAVEDNLDLTKRVGVKVGTSLIDLSQRLPAAFFGFDLENGDVRCVVGKRF